LTVELDPHGPKFGWWLKQDKHMVWQTTDKGGREDSERAGGLRNGEI
jgi:hypothetical protein